MAGLVITVTLATLGIWFALCFLAAFVAHVMDGLVERGLNELARTEAAIVGGQIEKAHFERLLEELRRQGPSILDA